MESYSYAKERRRFGKQCLFSEQNKVLESCMPDPSAARHFIRRDPVDNTNQRSVQFAASQLNTDSVELASHGINHIEGGWARDINPRDEEQTLRHRKKIERDDQYPIQMCAVLAPMVHACHQNTAVQLYETYFDDNEPIDAVESPVARTIRCFRHPVAKQTDRAAATHISFAPEGGTEMAVAYARMAYQAVQSADLQSNVWSLENPQVPLLALQCDAACTTLEYNLRDGRQLAGGWVDGKVCLWDSRVGGQPTAIARTEVTHRTRVTSLMWLHSKSNSEFMSGSSDGQLYFWDTRKFAAPIDELMTCDVQPGTAAAAAEEAAAAEGGGRQLTRLGRSFGVSVLEYEYTIPTKFLVGTEEGHVYFGNRKGVSAAEKLPAKMQCHNGPLRSLERNPTFVKNFMTVGDCRVKIFSEECRDNAIMWTRHQETDLTCGAWSPTRSSLLMVGRQDGVLDVWDVLVGLRRPVVSLKVSDVPLVTARAHEGGKMVACGDADGDTYLVELSEALTVNRKLDKMLLSAMFERETKREKIMEAKLREIRLKQKVKAEAEADEKQTTGGDGVGSKSPSASNVGSLKGKGSGTGSGASAVEVDEELEKVKRDFFEILQAERKRRDLNNKCAELLSIENVEEGDKDGDSEKVDDKPEKK